MTANAAAEAARDAIEQLHEDIDVADADRKSKLNELTKRVLRPSELDKQAVLDKPEGKRLTDRVTEALAAIEKIRRAIPDEKVDADPAVTQAKKAIEKAEQELAKHQQSIAAQRIVCRRPNNNYSSHGKSYSKLKLLTLAIRIASKFGQPFDTLDFFRLRAIELTFRLSWHIVQYRRTDSFSDLNGATSTGS